MKKHLILFSFLAICVLANYKTLAQEVTLKELNSGSQASLRGLSVVDEEIVWTSGTNGTVLMSTDGGNNWRSVGPKGADTLDFRGIYAFNEEEAIIISAGQPAVILKTYDGGNYWNLVFEDRTKKAFFDAISFWTVDDGIVMSDPVDGEFLLLITSNGGSNWKRVDPANIPDAYQGEAGFAASGTSLVTEGKKNAWFGTGGPASRVYFTKDGGQSWDVSRTPITPIGQATGIYSLAFKDSKNGIAVGGDYTKPEESRHNIVITTDGGLSWQKADDSGLRGYRSGVAYMPTTKNSYMAVGLSGMDLSMDGGKTWKAVSNESMNAVKFAPFGKAGYVTGPKGKIIKITYKK